MAINTPISPVAPQQKKGSGFVNLNKVIDANSNNKLGSAVAGGISNAASGVKTGLNQATTGFNQAADANNLASDQNTQARQQALMNIGSGSNTNVTDDQAKQFGTFLGGKYAGPTELDSSKVNQLSNKAQEVQGYGSALKAGGDKSGLLQSFTANKSSPYTYGQQKLDSTLLGKGPNAKALAQAGQQTRGLTNNITKEQNAAAQLGQLRAAQAQQFGKDTQQQLTDTTGNVTTGINTNLANFNTAQDKAIAAIQEAGRTGNISPEYAKLLGIPNADQGLNLYGANVADPNYINKPAATFSNIAKPEDIAKYNALAKLSGQTLEGLAPQYNAAEQKLNYDVNNPIQYNSDALREAITRGGNEQSAALSNPISYQNTPGELGGVLRNYSGGQASVSQVATDLQKQLADDDRNGRMLIKPADRAYYEKALKQANDQINEIHSKYGNKLNVQ